MTGAKEYLFMHASFQLEVLANHGEPNPPFRQVQKQDAASLAPSRSAEGRRRQREHPRLFIYTSPTIKLDVTAKS